MIIGTNTITHATTIGLFLTNSQQYPIKNPQLFASINKANTTQFPCTPNFVLPGGSIICTVTLPVTTSIGSFLSGSIYLNATYCGLSLQSYASTHNCSGGAKETYVGNFAGHTQPLVSTQPSISLTAVNYTQPANGNPDQLTAIVRLLGYPLRGATVNFTATNIIYPIAPNLTLTNSAGSALSSISGSYPGTVMVNAIYAGLNSSIIITFTAPIIISFVPRNFSYCASSTGATAIVDGVPYTCSQIAVKQFSYGKGTAHSYSFVTPVGVPPSTQEAFKEIQISGIAYPTNSGTLTANNNMTVPFDYYVQYYLTETANPAGAGSISPGIWMVRRIGAGHNI